MMQQQRPQMFRQESSDEEDSKFDTQNILDDLKDDDPSPVGAKQNINDTLNFEAMDDELKLPASESAVKVKDPNLERLEQIAMQIKKEKEEVRQIIDDYDDDFENVIRLDDANSSRNDTMI